VDVVDTNLLLGIGLAATAGGFLGWWFRKLGEDARRRAIEVYYREALKISEKARDRARAEAEQLDERMAVLRAEHEADGGRIESLQTSIGGMRKKDAGTKARMEQIKEEASRFQADAAELRLAIDELEARLSRAQSELEAKDAEIVAASGSEEIARLQAELTALQQAHADCGVESAELRHRIRELETHASAGMHAKLGGNGAPRWLLPSANSDQDDLRSIRGLGPVLERGLNELGIYYYRQVAKMTDKDIAWIAPRLNVFPGRIVSGDWATQARKLHQRKYREKL
jgi:predicted flap endonuclease-1-like 5' DNA nuclease